jgi:hypothetical protein
VVLVRLAGALAGAVSAVLLVTVLVRGAGPNLLNGWTIVLGFLATGLRVARAGRGHLLAAWIILVLAMAPALIGGLGLLYLPPPLSGVHETEDQRPRRDGAGG